MLRRAMTGITTFPSEQDCFQEQNRNTGFDCKGDLSCQVHPGIYLQDHVVHTVQRPATPPGCDHSERVLGVACCPCPQPRRGSWEKSWNREVLATEQNQGLTDPTLGNPHFLPLSVLEPHYDKHHRLRQVTVGDVSEDQ